MYRIDDEVDAPIIRSLKYADMHATILQLKVGQSFACPLTAKVARNPAYYAAKLSKCKVSIWTEGTGCRIQRVR